MDTINILSFLLNFFSTIVATLVGAVAAGFITLKVYRKFEFDRIKLNNVNEMYKDINPYIHECMASLGKISAEIKSGIEKNALVRISSATIEEMREKVFRLNTVADNYDIELEAYDDEFHFMLMHAKALVEGLKNMPDKFEIYQEKVDDINELVDELASFSEYISEIKRDALSGKMPKYK